MASIFEQCELTNSLADYCFGLPGTKAQALHKGSSDDTDELTYSAVFTEVWGLPSWLTTVAEC